MTTTSGAYAGLPGPVPGALPDPWTALRETGWPSLDTAYGTAGRIPRILAPLLAPDLTAEETRQALNALEPVRHQNTIYEATAPVALCIAAVLARRAERHSGAADRVCALLLDWLAGVAYDSDDACVNAGRQYFDDDFLEAYPAMVALRALRPLLYQAVAPFLDDPDTAVAEEALCAALAFAEHPGLAGHRDGLAERARRFLLTSDLTSDTRWRRRQALDALTAWDHDTTALTRPGDDDRNPCITGRSWPDADGYPDDPPF
ncbi:hypothetical protein ACFQ6N_17580 [Kitasatospora sp. NPDC056446]|uniref:hypothetical protein n=1 Tax=Kitasatospora sp. NPDC056446 TaxID=3345819 RepID=UPI0036956F15